tara:strand:- start:312 stop:419 length:108 start_codon:yes stop_codon:yes gene_type:complete
MTNTTWEDIAVVFIIWTAVISVALIDFDNLNIFGV